MQTVESASIHLRIRPRTRGFGRASTLRPGKGLTQVMLWQLCLGLIALSMVFARQRSLNDFAVVDSHATVEIAIVGATLILVLFSGRAVQIWRINAGTASGFLLIYYVFGAASALWSANPAFSFYRAVEVVCQIAAVHVALSY